MQKGCQLSLGAERGYTRMLEQKGYKLSDISSTTLFIHYILKPQQENYTKVSLTSAVF
jgi:hypothetical protein